MSMVLIEPTTFSIISFVGVRQTLWGWAFWGVLVFYLIQDLSSSCRERLLFIKHALHALIQACSL